MAQFTLRKLALSTVLTTSAFLSAHAQTSFDVATIRPSSARIPFERSGDTQFAYGTLKMRDVPVSATHPPATSQRI